MEAILACEVACGCGPRVWRVACTLRQMLQHFRSPVVEACVQKLRRHPCSAGRLVVALRDDC
eukprot:4412548-Pleurochrysis_carterae.AAC.1